MPYKNPLLDASGILRSWAEGKAEDLDHDCYVNDDGEEHSVDEAQQHIINETTKLIKSLERIRMDCKGMTWAAFVNRHT